MFSVQVKVNIDQHGFPRSTFHFTCYGRGGSKRRFSVFTAQLGLERGKVTRPVADLCQGGRVKVFPNQHDVPVNTGTNKLVELPLERSIKYTTTWPYEILTTFFHEHKITPTFVGHGKVDIAPGYATCSHRLSTMV